MIMMTWRDLSNTDDYSCIYFFCSVSGTLFHFWQNAWNFSACKKKKKKHPCLIFWKLWLPLLTCSASRFPKHEYVISIYYWNCVISVYGMTDELRTGQEVWLGHGGVRELWQSCLVSLVLDSWGGQGKSTQHTHTRWAGEQDVAWTVACNSDCVYVFCVTYITIRFTTHCWLRGEQKSREEQRRASSNLCMLEKPST